LDNALVYGLFGLILVFTIGRHWRRALRKEREAIAAAERNQLSGEGPKAQHPHIDVLHCIGCGACVDVCPEGDVLAVVAGKAAIVNGHKCIGHGLCAEACPVGAIEIVMASPSISADMPSLTTEYETNVPGLFIIGELGGLALIKNAVNQGRDCVDAIARRLQRAGPRQKGVYDVCIVGAGPGGISASLRAIERQLMYLTLEQDTMGGSVSKYPRQKVVLTSPVELPLHGQFRKLKISKENLLEFWGQLEREHGLQVHENEQVQQVVRDNDGSFTITTPNGRFRARTVILALGRRGTPRKLGILGEELPKVMYSLIDAEAYTGQRILVVGGGDSAVEAALGLAHQKGNQVTLSYRKEAFTRLKDRNEKRVKEAASSGRLKVLFNSIPVEIRPQSVAIEVLAQRQEIANDFVWVFAGGTPPNEFLAKCGVQMGPRDLTEEAAAVRRQDRPLAPVA